MLNEIIVIYAITVLLAEVNERGKILYFLLPL